MIMKKLLFFLCLAVSSMSMAQTPQGINYQAVAHDVSGNPLANQNATIRLGILSSSPTGTLEWEEEHSVTTNDYGLFDLVIGVGTSTGLGSQTSFANIDWSLTTHYLKVEMDAGSGFELIGTMQFMSVPYALHAETVAQDNVDDADSDPNNETISEIYFSNDTLFVTEAGGTIKTFIPTAAGDNWGTEVVNSDASLSGDGTAASPLGVNGDLTDDQNLIYTQANQTLDISGGNSVTLNVDDADADPSNELITNATLNGTNLELTDAGGLTTVDLSSLQSSTDTLDIIKNLTLGSYVHAISGNTIELGFGVTPYFTLDSNNRIDLPNNNGSLFLGPNPGGLNQTTGSQNFGFGGGALNNLSSGFFNTGIGSLSLNQLTTGAENVALGRGSLSTITDGSGNVALGYYALASAGVGSNDNIAIGYDAGANWTGGYQNIMIGYRAGALLGTGSGNNNIKIGANAGTNDSGDNKMYIGTHNGSTSLIYGNMNSDSLIVNGSLSVGNAFTFPTTDGANGEILTTDGAGQLSWAAASGDSDWTPGAGFIYNDIDYVGIGTNTPSSLYELSVFQGAGNGILNQVASTGSAAAYGFRNELIGTMTGDRYANYITINNGSTGNWYGTWNNITPANGSTNNITGTYNNFTSGDGRKTGMYNNFSGAGSNLMEGLANYFAPDGFVTAQGVINNINGVAGHTGVSYGIRNNISGGTGTKYGSYSSITPTGTEFTYGFYSNYSSANPNTYGIYTNGETKNYFSGNVGIGVTNPTYQLDVNGTGEFVQLQIAGQYVLPTVDGLNGQVMTTDGAGNLSWTNSGDNDWISGTDVIYNITDSVGIGTTLPRTKLELYGSSNVTNIYSFNGSPSTTFAIHNDDITNSNYSSLSFSTRATNNGNYNSARIVAVNQNHTAGSVTSDLVFMTREASNITEAMRITGDNRIGFGTVAPSTDLHLVGSMRIEDGTQAAGNVLTSDATGNATWKPKSISFFEGMDPSNSNQTISQNITTKLQFQSGGSTFALNDGGGYSPAAFEFQAPVAGVYQFNVNMVFAGAPSGYFTMDFVHSSGNLIAEKSGFFNTIGQNWHTDNMHVTVHLNAGESVWIEVLNTNGGMTFYTGKSSFSGHLVYAD